MCKVGTVTWIRQDSLKINTGNEGQQHAKHLRSLGWDTAMSPSLQSYGSPKPPSLSLYTPARGAPSLQDRQDGGSQVPRGYLSSCCSAQPQRFQVVWGGGWPPAVQFSRSSWPLLKR